MNPERKTGKIAAISLSLAMAASGCSSAETPDQSFLPTAPMQPNNPEIVLNSPYPFPQPTEKPEPTPSATYKPGPGKSHEPGVIPEPINQGKPDIFVIVMDDIAPLNSDFWNRFPNIKSVFIDHGITFTNFNGETPLCCPGRAEYLTGLHSFHNGVTKNNAKLFHPGETIATELQVAGYHTFISGKYLNKFENVADKNPPGWDDKFIATGEAREYNWVEWDDGQKVKYGNSPKDFRTDVAGVHAINEIYNSSPDIPLFGWITPVAPHVVDGGPEPEPAKRHINDPACRDIPLWNPPNYNEQDVSDKPLYVQNAAPLLEPEGMDLTKICESVMAVDDMVGEMVKALKDTGRFDNTLFILADDNGMNFGAHGLIKKNAPYAAPMPFFMSWPAKIGTTPRSEDEPLLNIDLAPTLAAIAGRKMGPYPTGQENPDGIDFQSIIYNQTHDLSRDAILLDHPAGADEVPGWYSVVTEEDNPLGHWQYTGYVTGERELYDLDADPWELQNLADDKRYQEVEQELKSLLQNLEQS